MPLHNRPGWRPYVALIVLTLVLALQNSKSAMLPAKQTPLLWTAELVVLVGVLILRSGWARDNRWEQAQGNLGTLANNFYEPRREALIFGTALGTGVLGALWWATATWSVVLGGMNRHVIGRGLIDFEVAALTGAATGAVIGAVVGLAVGHVWETRHRRRRVNQRGSHA